MQRWLLARSRESKGSLFDGRCGSINYCACLKFHGVPLVTLVVQQKSPASQSDKEGIGRAARLIRLMLHDLSSTLEANRATTELTSLREAIPLTEPVPAEASRELSRPKVASPAKSAEPSVATHLRQVVLRMLDYIGENYARPLQLNDLAASFKMNASYLSALFSQEMGVTFHHYLEELRLARARELLCDPTHRVGEISCAVGYSNPNHFRNVFKTRFGVPPSVWREQTRPVGSQASA